MSYLRMVTKKGLWEEEKDKNVNDLSSDIITNCLRTQENTLSLWKISENADIDKAILALSSNRQSLQKLDYIIIPVDKINMQNIKINASSMGNTPYKDFNNEHADIVEINYANMAEVASLILSLVKSGKGKIVRKNRLEIKKMLLKAIDDKIIDTQDIYSDLLVELGLAKKTDTK